MSSNLPPDIPAEAVPFLEEVGYLRDDALHVGDVAPAVPLFSLDGRPVDFLHSAGGLPVVLIFGSHT